MAVFDTHKAFAALTAAGFSERQAQALVEVGGDGYGALATRADIADMATKSDLQALERATKSDLQALERATKSDLQALELRLTAALERRMNNLILQLALLQVAVGGLIVAALKLLP